jgi:hypothetical protein
MSFDDYRHYFDYMDICHIVQDETDTVKAGALCKMQAREGKWISRTAGSGTENGRLS